MATLKAPVMVVSRKKGIPKSLLEAIMERPDDFVKEIKGNMKIIDFGTFVTQLKSKYGTNPARPYLFLDMDKEILRVLFNSDTVKSTIVRNIGSKKAEEMYKQESQQTLPTVIPPTAQAELSRMMAPKAPVIVTINTYRRRGRAISGYKRSVSRQWSPAHTKFLQVRKMKGQKPADILREFNQSFSSNQRSYESLRKKYYRI